MTLHYPDLKDIISQSPLRVVDGEWCYCQCKEHPGDVAFMVSKDSDEYTAVVERAVAQQLSYTGLVGWYKLIEAQISVPFKGVGFLATIAQTVADNGHNILLVSTFSKDYFLLKVETYTKDLEALQNIGFLIITSE